MPPCRHAVEDLGRALQGLRKLRRAREAARLRKILDPTFRVVPPFEVAPEG